MLPSNEILPDAEVGTPPVPRVSVVSGTVRRFTAIDLFSGCGGMTTGLKQADFSVIGAVEIDPLAVESYKLNHGGIKVWDADIRDVDTQEVMERLNIRPGQLSLLGGCPPCQGFSTLRTRNRGRAVADDRNDLVFEFMRFVRDLRPAAVMMENVPNLARDPRMDLVLAELRELGYDIDEDSVRVLDAADYGVPQRRRRMILVGVRGRRVAFASTDSDRTTVATAIGHLHRAGSGTDPLHDYAERRSDRVTRMIRAIPKDGGGRFDLPPELRLACHLRTDGYRDVYGRMAWSDVAPTITSGCYNPSRGRFLHPDADRAITLREALLLQSFPDGYRLSLRRGREAAAAMVGNALPPRFVSHHASVIRRVLEEVVA